MAETVKRRSTLRAEHAALTRSRILAAAAAVFAEHGFSGTRIEDVAERAGVAVPTVYKVFTNKASLLVGALNQALAGSGAESPVDQQSWFIEQLDEPDPRRQLQLIARNARQMYERAGGQLVVLRAAEPLAPSLADAWNQIVRARLTRSRRTATSLRTKAGNRVRTTVEETALMLFTLTEPQLFTTYTAAGRTADQYERWLADLLCRAILE